MRGHHRLAMGTTTNRGGYHGLTVVASMGRGSPFSPGCLGSSRPFVFSCVLFSVFVDVLPLRACMLLQLRRYSIHPSHFSFIF